MPFILPQSLTRPGIPKPTVWLGVHNKDTILHAIYRVSLAEWVAGGRVSRERECAVAGSRRSRCLRSPRFSSREPAVEAPKILIRYSFPVCMRGNSGAPLGAPGFSRSPTDARRSARGLASHPPLQTATVLACARTPSIRGYGGTMSMTFILRMTFIVLRESSVQWTLLPSYAKMPSAFKPYPHPKCTRFTATAYDITPRVPSCVLITLLHMRRRRKRRNTQA